MNNELKAMPPGPVPLPPKEQREMQLLMKRAIAEQEAAEQAHQKQKDQLSNENEKETLSAAEASNTGERDGPKGPEPTRFGDWERKGRVYDF